MDEINNKTNRLSDVDKTINDEFITRYKHDSFYKLLLSNIDDIDCIIDIYKVIIIKYY